MKRFSKYLSLKIEFLLIPLLAIRHNFEIGEEVNPRLADKTIVFSKHEVSKVVVMVTR